jgi:N-methylhydantoinase A
VGERWTISIDAGGTFTDAVATGSGGALRVTKVPSTPHDPSEGLVAAVRELLATGIEPEDVQAVFHGTTVATNAAIQGQLARVALLCSEGSRDILSHRDGRRPKLYDMAQPRPSELVRRRDRIEVRERLSSRGEVVVALETDEIKRVVDEVVGRDPEAVAICLLFSYLDDTHEQRLAEAVRERLPAVPVSCSAEVAREFREYPRTATTVYNAGLRPLVGRYLKRAQQELRTLGVKAPFQIIQSNGGSVPADRADEQSHQLLLSGPTAAVSGALALADRVGLDRLISLDMGGTSLDVCLMEGATPPVRVMQEVGGHPVLSPAVDVEAVGAGGGSIARVDATGRLTVGPHSAGAVPGPVAYGRGGREVTVTDANVAVGTLGDTPLAGRLALRHEEARAAVKEIGQRLGLDLEEAGRGILAVSLAHMVRALRRVSVDRGLDPRGFAVLAFGGAGPLHASALLKELPLAAVVVPPHPGLFSAAGLVAADQRIDDSRTILRVLDPTVVGLMAEWFEASILRLRSQLVDDGVTVDRIRFEASADCRYQGQGFELRVDLPSPTGPFESLAEAFNALHERTYGHSNPDERVEVVTLRLSAFGSFEHPVPAEIAVGGPEPEEDAVSGHRRLALAGGVRDAAVYRRAALKAGNVLVGPAIVEEMDSTTLILHDQQAEVDREGNLWIRELGA